MKIQHLLRTSQIPALIILLVTSLLTSCEEEDPFVDRTVSPVLIVFDETVGYLSGGGLTSVPSIVKPVTALNYNEPVVLSLSVYELDKSGILDYTVGIDSIPVSNLAMTFTKRDGTLPLEGVSDSDGKLSITTTWQALGVANAEAIATAPAARSITIPVSWKGTHKGQSFMRYAQVVFTKRAS